MRGGILLIEAQIAALEEAEADKEAHGEFGKRMSPLLRDAGHVPYRCVQLTLYYRIGNKWRRAGVIYLHNCTAFTDSLFREC